MIHWLKWTEDNGTGMAEANRVAFCKKKHIRHGVFSIDYGSIIVKKDKENAIRITNIRMLLRFSYFTFDPNNLEIIGRVHRLSWVFGSR